MINPILYICPKSFHVALSNHRSPWFLTTRASQKVKTLRGILFCSVFLFASSWSLVVTSLSRNWCDWVVNNGPLTTSRGLVDFVGTMRRSSGLVLYCIQMILAKCFQINMKEREKEIFFLDTHKLASCMPYFFVQQNQ